MNNLEIVITITISSFLTSIIWQVYKMVRDYNEQKKKDLIDKSKSDGILYDNPRLNI
jgi:hypothetical protein